MSFISPKEKFKKYLRQKGLKLTPEREAVLNCVFEIHEHFEADDLLIKIKEKGYQVSRGTIYRTLPLLVDCDLIRKVEFVDKHYHYEHVHGHKHHEHLICISCGKVIEFTNEIIERELENECEKNGFVLSAHKIEGTGWCKSCY
jgi:Fur family ferric uptake transcriptional regulator